MLRQAPHTHGLKIATFSPGQRSLEIILQQKFPEEHAHSRPHPDTNPEDFGTLCLQIELETVEENHGKLAIRNWDLGATLKSKNGLVGHLQLSSITSWVSKREAIYTPTSANTYFLPIPSFGQIIEGPSQTVQSSDQTNQSTNRPTDQASSSSSSSNSITHSILSRLHPLHAHTVRRSMIRLSSRTSWPTVGNLRWTSGELGGLKTVRWHDLANTWK